MLLILLLKISNFKLPHFELFMLLLYFNNSQKNLFLTLFRIILLIILYTFEGYLLYYAVPSNETHTCNINLYNDNFSIWHARILYDILISYIQYEYTKNYELINISAHSYILALLKQSMYKLNSYFNTFFFNSDAKLIISLAFSIVNLVTSLPPIILAISNSTSLNESLLTFVNVVSSVHCFSIR